MADLKQEVFKSVLSAAANLGQGLYVQAYTCVARVYLSPRHKNILFGHQPAEQVTVIGPKGELAVSVADANADQTRVELSYTEAARLGLKNLPIYDGTTRGGAPCILRGSEGKATLDHGVVAPARTLCISADYATAYGLTENQRISAEIDSPDRSLILGNILVSICDDDSLALYLDIDEASASGLTEGQYVKLLTTSP
ncbi:MAG: hypothetical protein FWC72_02065 [Oscillospiraceae bacterium]|nr:hypothetical protein [Oscillospiraceae bacterium]